MVTKKSFVWLNLLFMLLFGSPTAAQDQLTLMLDWFPNVDHLPIYAAQGQKWFEKENIQLKIISPSETSDALKLAAAGQVDLAVSYEPQTIIAASRQIKITAVGRLIEHPLTTLMFLKNKGIKIPADLSHRKIGYTVPGLMDVLLAAFAKQNQIEFYEPVNVGFAILQSLATSKVDAVMGPFKTYETVTMAQKGYEVEYFELEKYGIPDYDELIFVCGTQTLKDKSAAIERFVRVINQGIQMVRQSPGPSLETYFQAVPEADRQIEKEAFKRTQPFYAAIQQFDVQRWQTFADFAYMHGLIENKVDVTTVIWQPKMIVK